MQTDPTTKALWLAQYANITDNNPNATVKALSGATIPAGGTVKAYARILEAMGKFNVNWNFDAWSGYQVSGHADGVC